MLGSRAPLSKGAMAGPSIEIRSATEDETPEAVAAIVAAFITDPVARFAFPSPNGNSYCSVVTHFNFSYLYFRNFSTKNSGIKQHLMDLSQ